MVDAVVAYRDPPTGDITRHHVDSFKLKPVMLTHPTGGRRKGPIFRIFCTFNVYVLIFLPLLLKVKIHSHGGSI